MKWDLVIFDLDGTLLDTIGDLGAAVDRALQLRGLPRHSLEEYKAMVGHGVKNLVKQALPEERRDEETVMAALVDFRQWYEAHIAVKTKPYPGIPELLRDLAAAGVRLAVASNKFHEGTVALIERYFPDIEFVAVLGNKPGLPLKPDAEVVRSILRASGVAPGRAVLVGDSVSDIRTARSGGVACLAVAWGYRPATALAAALAEQPAAPGDSLIVPDVPSLRHLLLD
jgi:phosphoglycolate phosphatase